MQKKHLLFSPNMFLSWFPPFLYNIFFLGTSLPNDAQSDSAPCCSSEAKREPTQSRGKLPIKIQHCMVMNTRPMVKGSH